MKALGFQPFRDITFIASHGAANGDLDARICAGAARRRQLAQVRSGLCCFAAWPCPGTGPEMTDVISQSNQGQLFVVPRFEVKKVPPGWPSGPVARGGLRADGIGRRHLATPAGPAAPGGLYARPGLAFST